VKALYLDGRCRLDVRLDGPALRVRRPGRADGRYPLQRVGRVIAIGAVHWHPDALAACLREHKPIAVLDHQGRFVRLLFQPPTSAYGLARHLGELLEVARFRVRYERWYAETERAEMALAAGFLGTGRADWPPDTLWQAIRIEQHRRRRTGASTAIFSDWRRRRSPLLFR